MSGYPRVIIYAAPEDMILVARMATTLAALGYVRPKDGITAFQYGDNPRQTFCARRNKSGFTIYGPNHAPKASAQGEG